MKEKRKKEYKSKGCKLTSTETEGEAYTGGRLGKKQSVVSDIKKGEADRMRRGM